MILREVTALYKDGATLAQNQVALSAAFRCGYTAWWGGFMVRKGIVNDDQWSLKVQCNTGKRDIVTSLMRWDTIKGLYSWDDALYDGRVQIRLPSQVWIVGDMDTMIAITEVLNTVLMNVGNGGQWHTVMWESDEPGRYEMYLTEWGKPRYLLTGKWINVR